eukprot:CAMPEP_0114497714 /NCGR_PEP_ID=MMETSP0109-20121206/6480_1 /TAXON_ID=29199 /ORGANISM="Chlorarachnion reptans, Strain CCCM449" /LENGTH=214 /DNA_ID=CAMNT_0001675131 /DNA_START=187 /DNA_END=831 /DNA_ORIENTATION=-
MEVTDAVRGGPGMTRSTGPLRVSSRTDALKLRGALSARLTQEGVAEMQAAGQMAIGTALKAIAIIGTPRAADDNRPPPRNTGAVANVKFRRDTVMKDGELRNLTIVSFEVSNQGGEEIKDGAGETIRVSRITHIGPLASKITSEFKEDPTKTVTVRVMGPQATSIAMKALCVTRNQLAEDGVTDTPQFKAQFIRENDLSIVEIKVGIQKEEVTK